jgi:LDH2 family malate/lactate/ureidoglycolate dehydrogenase
MAPVGAPLGMSGSPAIFAAAEDCRALVAACCARLGLSDADARAVAEVLVDANLRGTDSHGIARLPIYMRRLRVGLAGGTERMSVPAAFGPLCRLDAGRALGPALGVRAVDHAIGLARQFGIGLVAVANSTHFGAAGFYARRAAEQEMLAIVFSNGPANLAPYGASERFLGTNAIAIAAPLGRHGEFVLDMSSSIVARGKIIRQRELGEAIDAGLAIDPDGNPTQDPAAALAGAVLPVGGAKGSGLAFAVCLLAGVLGGGAFDDEIAPMYGGSERPQDVGHAFLVVDPWRLGDSDEVLPRVEALVDRLHALRPANGFDRARFAGERGDAVAAERRRTGIPIEPAELDAVAAACEECGMPDLAYRARSLARLRQAA